MSPPDGFPLEDDADRSMYAVLNVSRTASTQDVTRAYRKLAQVLHPDKHQDEAKRAQAQEAFSKLQEAYEVLSDPHKREVYDVYGKTGLTAGLEVGDHLRSKDQLRKQWEEFMAEKQTKAAAQAVVTRSSYVCRVDARSLVRGQGMGPGTLFKTVQAQSSLEAVLDDRNVVTAAGQAAMRPLYVRTADGRVQELAQGGGNIVFGYKRMISTDDTLDVSAQVGLQSLLSVTSTRQLCRLTGRQGWVAGSWGPRAGAGLQVGCSQFLFSNSCEGSVNLVLGPSGATGVTTSITKRGNKWNITGKLEIGAVHSIQARGSVTLTEGLTARAIARLGTTGIDLELGLLRRLGPQVTGYMGTVVGYPSGVLFKVRVTRAGQSLECPVLLAASHKDWKVLAAAYVLPPLVYWVTLRYVVRPTVAWARAARERAHSAQELEAVKVSLRKASDEQALLDVVARRKAVSEQAQPAGGGVVVLLAVYGHLEPWLTAGGVQTFVPAAEQQQQHQQAEAVLQQQQQQGQQCCVSELAQGTAQCGGEHTHVNGVSSSDSGSNGKYHATGSDPVSGDTERNSPITTPCHSSQLPRCNSSDQGSDHSPPRGANPTPSSSSSASSSSASSTARSHSHHSTSNSRNSSDSSGSTVTQGDTSSMPPPWLDVTLAVQYLVTDSKLQLHPGVSKAGLMGFADPAPHMTDPRGLYVAYTYQGAVYEVKVMDMESLKLPGAGVLVSDAEQVAALRSCSRW